MRRLAQSSGVGAGELFTLLVLEAWWSSGAHGDVEWCVDPLPAGAKAFLLFRCRRPQLLFAGSYFPVVEPGGRYRAPAVVRSWRAALSWWSWRPGGAPECAGALRGASILYRRALRCLSRFAAGGTAAVCWELRSRGGAWRQTQGPLPARAKVPLGLVRGALVFYRVVLETADGDVRGSTDGGADGTGRAGGTARSC